MLSLAEAGSSGSSGVRFVLIHFHALGTICITPTAPAFDTTSLFQPLSCHPTASAKVGGTSFCVAISPISAPDTRCGVGCGRPLAAGGGSVVVCGPSEVPPVFG